VAFEHEGILYLEFNELMGLYGDVIGCVDDEAVNYIRYRAGVELALARPMQWATYQQADIVTQAAALGHGIAETQCFIDGNKRLAIVAIITFLDINEYDVIASEDTLFDLMISLSTGLLPGDFAHELRPHVKPRFPDF
jgi:death-on-curing family protein